jgi:CheY-like chemotaxis protein
MFLPRTYRPLSESSIVAAEPPRGGETVLLVEDNLEVQETVGMLLDQLGYRVFRAGSAAAALQLLQSGEAVDLVFSDIVMPGELDGMALARQVKEEYPDIAVLLTSGYAKAVNAREANFPILRKPYQLATLARAIRDALDIEPAQLLI